MIMALPPGPESVEVVEEKIRSLDTSSHFSNSRAVAANSDPTETEARNLSLRELHWARGLFLAGDVEGLGRSILETYANDLRGHYARHARSLLEFEN